MFYVSFVYRRSVRDNLPISGNDCCAYQVRSVLTFCGLQHVAYCGLQHLIKSLAHFAHCILSICDCRTYNLTYGRRAFNLQSHKKLVQGWRFVALTFCGLPESSCLDMCLTFYGIVAYRLMVANAGSFDQTWMQFQLTLPSSDSIRVIFANI